MTRAGRPASPLVPSTRGVKRSVAAVVLVFAVTFACSSASTSNDVPIPPVIAQNPTVAPPVSPPSTTPPIDASAQADATPEVCTPRDTDAPPKSASYPVTLSGQAAWIHDDGVSAGYFHTFDALTVGTAGAHKVHVMLPRSYPGSCKRYPVVYFNDGDTTFWKGGAANKTWDVPGALAKAYAAGTFGEVIVVAIVPVDRNREYTHVPWLAGQTCCGLPDYVSYLSDAVKPFVDAAYRTKSGANETVIVGSSHGGLAAFYTATTRPTVFGRAIAMSSSFWAGLDEVTIGGPLSGSALMQAAGPGLLAHHPRMYLDWGLVRTGGTHNAIIEARATARSTEMRDLLASNYGYGAGASLFTVEDPAGEHDEESWARRIGPALAIALAP